MIISSSVTGMGDTLLLTAIAKHIANNEVHLLPQAKKFVRFFRDISSKIVITNNITPLHEIGYDHYTLRKLRPLGLADKCYLPYVSVNDNEVREGLELIKEYRNPIVFVANSSAQWKMDREPPKQYFQDIINNLKNHHDILQFGLSSNFTKFEHTIPLLDIDIETLIKYYSAIKNYIGVDTGDTHLMLAVGGRCNVHVPRTGSRIAREWNYNYPNIIQYHYFN